MTYGFQLLEDIRQVRMGCEEKRDEIEQRFTVELQNWMKYSQQTQQVISKADFENTYASETRQTVENTITSTYREIYSSRARRLNNVERQCNEELEELLQQRKLSMLVLVADLMSRDMDALKKLVKELGNYTIQLQNGLQRCVQHQTLLYESRLSAKLLTPYDFCSGPDIEILIAFLKRMLVIIIEEQTLFFGDDEDLGMDSPCGISGCGDVEEDTEEFYTPTPPSSQDNIQPTTRPSRPPPTPSSHKTSTTPTQPYTLPHTNTEAHTSPTTSQPQSVSTESDYIPTEPVHTEDITETNPITTDTGSEATADIKPSVSGSVTTIDEITPDTTETRLESETPTSTDKQQPIIQLGSQTTAIPTGDLQSPTTPGTNYTIQTRYCCI